MYKPILCILVSSCLSLAGRVTYVTPKKPSDECGVERGGAIVQKIASPNKIYKGFFWDEEPGVLLSVSPPSVEMNAYTYETGEMYTSQVKELKGSKLVKQIPCKGNPLKFILVTDKALYVLNVTMANNQTTYTLQLYKTLFNNQHSIVSALTDPKGNILLGVSNTQKPYGSLLRFIFGDNTTLTVESKNAAYTDSSCNENHTIGYVADCEANVVRSYKLDKSASSGVSDVNVVFNMTLHAKGFKGHVSCITADKDGNLWLGLRGGGAVVQYDPNKQVVLQIIGVPATDVEAVMFGGPDMSHLFVGTRQKPFEPDSGSIFAISGTGSQGFPGYLAGI